MGELLDLFRMHSGDMILSGVVMIYVMYHPKMDKTVYLFGEEHGIKEENTITISEIIGEMITERGYSKPLDIILEMDPVLHETDDGNRFNMFNDVHPTDIVRIHYGDIRYLNYLSATRVATCDIPEYVESCTLFDPETRRKTDDIATSMLISCAVKPIIRILVELTNNISSDNMRDSITNLIYEQIHSIIDDNVRNSFNDLINRRIQLLKDELDKVETRPNPESGALDCFLYDIRYFPHVNDDLMQYMMRTVRQQLYDDYYPESIRYVRNSLLHLSDIDMKIHDLYVIGKILTSSVENPDYMKNILLYMGSYHIVDILVILDSLGFEILYSVIGDKLRL